MKAILSAVQLASSLFAGSGKLREHNLCSNDSLSVLDEDFFEVVDFAGGCPQGSPQLATSSCDNSFEVDLEAEDQMILQTNTQRKFFPNYNFARIGKTTLESRLLEELCSLSNRMDAYSCEDNGQILFLTCKLL